MVGKVEWLPNTLSIVKRNLELCVGGLKERHQVIENTCLYGLTCWALEEIALVRELSLVNADSRDVWLVER